MPPVPARRLPKKWADKAEVTTMRKHELVTALLMHADKSLPRSNVEVVLKSLAKAATLELVRTGQFSLPGVGRFVVKERKPRLARNPHTGASVTVPARRVAGFRPCKALRDGL